MCDYSLHHVKSRPAKVGDWLTTLQFYVHTRRLLRAGRYNPRSLRTAGNRVVLRE